MRSLLRLRLCEIVYEAIVHGRGKMNFLRSEENWHCFIGYITQWVEVRFGRK